VRQATYPVWLVAPAESKQSDPGPATKDTTGAQHHGMPASAPFQTTVAAILVIRLQAARIESPTGACEPYPVRLASAVEAPL